MKRYCFDTSGFSNPHETMPEDIPIYVPLWAQMVEFVESGAVAATTEIYSQMCKIPDDFGECLRQNKARILLEVGDASWSFQTYIDHFTRMQRQYHAHISEYSHAGSKRTIDIPDLTIIALGRTLGIPVVSMEVTTGQSPDKRRIPDICLMEGVVHRTFNEFLKDEKIGT